MKRLPDKKLSPRQTTYQLRPSHTLQQSISNREKIRIIKNDINEILQEMEIKNNNKK